MRACQHAYHMSLFGPPNLRQFFQVPFSHQLFHCHGDIPFAISEKPMHIILPFTRRKRLQLVLAFDLLILEGPVSRPRKGIEIE